MSWLITGSQPVPVDPVFNNVSLLLHGNGTNGSTTITDSSPTPKTVTAVGNAQISTAQSKFGGSSIAFDGTGDYLTIPSNSAFNFELGDFCVETWVYVTAYTPGGTDVICSTYLNSVIGWTLGIFAGTGKFYGAAGGDGAQINDPNTLITNQWVHLAFTRSGSTLRFFVNGLLSGTPRSYSTSMSSTSSLHIGTNVGGGPLSLNGYIDDLRITKGVARYTANFTPPSAPFPDI